MTHTPNLFALKLVVISLGVAMLGGIVFVLTSIVHKANAEMGEQHCNDTVLHLEGHGTLSGVVPQGKTVQVTIVSGADTKVLTLDRCTGTLLHTFTVTP